MQSCGVITKTRCSMFKYSATCRAFSKSGESSNPTEKAMGFFPIGIRNREAIDAINELSKPPDNIKPNKRFPIKRFSTESIKTLRIFV